ncbi:EcsC family protein [Salicibibacter halophilus]|nr:EcsC family protein [Salicibibacter halophilus]
MDAYEIAAQVEMNEWRRKMAKNPSLTKTWTKGFQNKINQRIPDRVHKTMASAVRGMIESTLTGSDYVTATEPLKEGTLKDREEQLEETIQKYKRTASIEGAGTGFGGIFMGMADFPLLLGIKMRFLFTAAHLYGFDPVKMEERLFLLQVFQMAFSGNKNKQETLARIDDWESFTNEFPGELTADEAMDWVSFQLEYRDFIDVPKTLQLIPGFGAIVGATVNYHFLDLLGEAAKNCYRIRWFHEDKNNPAGE